MRKAATAKETNKRQWNKEHDRGKDKRENKINSRARGKDSKEKDMRGSC
jgi:hypothetical protein